MAFGRAARTRGTSYIDPEVLDESLNRCGRTRAMTVFTPIRPWYRPPGGTVWVRVVFALARRQIRRPGPTDIERLSFIHFARWGIISRIPEMGQPAEHLRQPLFMFESNYNGTFNQFIDSFANILTSGMNFFWGSSYGFPSPKPVARFIEYIHANEYIAQHYYSAYPTATTTMIVCALDLEEAHEKFRESAPSLSPEGFAAAYEEFLTAQQAKL